MKFHEIPMRFMRFPLTQRAIRWPWSLPSWDSYHLHREEVWYLEGGFNTWRFLGWLGSQFLKTYSTKHGDLLDYQTVSASDILSASENLRVYKWLPQIVHNLFNSWIFMLGVRCGNVSTWGKTQSSLPSQRNSRSKFWWQTISLEPPEVEMVDFGGTTELK
jgi:hypothetical protein